MYKLNYVRVKKKVLTRIKRGDKLSLTFLDFFAGVGGFRRGRVGKEIANTLTCSCNQAVVIKSDKVNETNISNCIDSNYGKGLDNHGQRTGVMSGCKIRRLTPKECWRLQGWKDEDFEKAAKVCSDSQLYKQAGNGVTVNVIYEIAKRLSN